MIHFCPQCGAHLQGAFSETSDGFKCYTCAFEFVVVNPYWYVEMTNPLPAIEPNGNQED